MGRGSPLGPKRGGVWKGEEMQLPETTHRAKATMREISYDAYLNTEYWAELRAWIVERDGDACRVCCRRENLQVHHRRYGVRGAEDPEDLITLCHGCHEIFHTYRNTFQQERKRRRAPVESNVDEALNHLKRIADNAISARSDG